jgi:hypothetical protein
MAKIEAQSKPTSKGRKCTSIHIEKAANGYSVKHRLEEAPRKTGSIPMFGGEQPPAPAVFNGKKAKNDMLAHVGGLADQMGDQDDAGEQEA